MSRRFHFGKDSSLRTGRAPGRRRPCVPCATERTESPAREAIETSRTRLLITGALVMLAFTAVGGRLFDLTVLHPAEEPRDRRAVTAHEYEPKRADIVDRNGTILATELTTASLYANPRRVLDPEEAARLVAEALPGLDRAHVAARLKMDRSFVWLQRNLTPEQQWEIHRLGIPGLDFQREGTRVYPHGSLASHVVGFANIDNRGISGIEKSFDEQLRQGQEPLALSLDARLQHIMRSALAEAMNRFSAIGAAGVVLDIRTGEVLSLVSLPDFDPNRPRSADQDALFNRVSLGIYELGSAFKIFTTAMALDSGVVDMRGGYDATNPIQVARFTIRDYHAKRRWLSVSEIFMYSSNIGAAKMATDVGGPTQRAYLKQFGILDPLPLELPEISAPMAPQVWRPVNTMTIAFGHGIAISPMHLASGVAAVINDGIYQKPTLVKHPEGVPPPKGQRVVSRETSKEMRNLLRLVVEQGTGKAAEAKGYRVGGKTGTAEKQGRGGYIRRSLISSFVAAFPMDEPRYLVLALLDEPKGTKETHGFATGGWVAAPVIRQVVERMAPIIGVAPVDEPPSEGPHGPDINQPSERPRLASF